MRKPIKIIDMDVATGNTRRVYMFKHIVIKIARIYWYPAIRNQIHSLIFELKIIRQDGRGYFRRKKEIKIRHAKNKKEYEEDRIKKEQRLEMRVPTVKCYEVYGTMAICLFGGIMANYQEWKFYRKTKNVFAMPTYFSFFGLLNIQKRGEKIDFWEGVGVWRYIYSNTQNYHQPFCDPHSLSEIENFCLDNGHLKIVDYGSRRVQPFLEINGEKLYNNFKIPD